MKHRITVENMTVAELIQALADFPADATVHPYDAESEGIRIDGADGALQVGFIETRRIARE